MSDKLRAEGVKALWCRIFAALIMSVLFSVPSFSASAQTSLLTDNQRRAYLTYYAPIIMKRGNGNAGDRGRDWITNFDYDRDGDYSNNADNYLSGISSFITNAQFNQNIPQYESWKIRPTLYTYIIEYMDGGRKDLVLQYHIYYAATEGSWGAKKIHDWERVEVRIKGVTGSPGTGEQVDFVVLTNHHRHIVRTSTDTDMHFMSTPTGKHVLVWQAEWSGRRSAAYGNELRFVQDSYAQITAERVSNAKAEVEVSSKDKDKNVHYVYAPEGSASAVSAWGAQEITGDNAHQLYSGYDNEVTARWNAVKRISYELQDIADISASHWAGNLWQNRWRNNDPLLVRIKSPMRLDQAEFSTPPNGLQTFYVKVDCDSRKGYIDKTWFWGVYTLFRDACNTNITCDEGREYKTHAFNGVAQDKYGRTRDQANNDPNFSHGINWYQHDYFAHTGQRRENHEYYEDGHWLVGDWYKAANGGFDGRWIQLFDDRLEDNTQSESPLSVSFSAPSGSCYGVPVATVSVSGSTAPYTVVWKRNGSTISTQTTTNSSSISVNNTSLHSVQVISATSQSWSRNFRKTGSCSGPYL